MNKTEFIEKWWVRDDLDPSDFKSDLSALIEQEKRKAAIGLLKSEHDKEGLDTNGIKYDLIYNEYLKQQ